EIEQHHADLLLGIDEVLHGPLQHPFGQHLAVHFARIRLEQPAGSGVGLDHPAFAVAHDDAAVVAVEHGRQHGLEAVAPLLGPAARLAGAVLGRADDVAGDGEDASTASDAGNSDHGRSHRSGIPARTDSVPTTTVAGTPRARPSAPAATA